MIKKLMCVVVIFATLLANSTVFAESVPNVTASVSGKIAPNENIKIVIDVENIDSFYAGSVKLKYNNQILKITGFEKGDLITKSGTNVFDAGNKIDEANGVAEFGGFSCLGHVNGFSGSGTFLVIEAQVLKAESFQIKSVPFLKKPDDNDNLQIQLINKDIKEVNYNFTGIDFKVISGGTAGTVSKVTTTVAGTTSNSSNSDGVAINSNGQNSGSSPNNVINNTIYNKSKAGNSEKGNVSASQGSINTVSNNGTSNTKGTSEINNKVAASEKWRTYKITGIVVLIMLVILGYIIVKYRKIKGLRH